MKRSSAALCVVLSLGVSLFACGGGDELVTLDPDFRLLRVGLPAPDRYQPPQDGALTGVLQGWGNGAWLPDAARGGMLNEKLPFGAPRRAPARSSAVEVELSLQPDSGSLQGRASLVLTAEDAAIEQVRFRLSAQDIDEVGALAGPESSFMYEDGILTVTPASPIAVGESWTLEILWHDQDVALIVDDFPESGGSVLANQIDPKITFLTYGYYYWPRLVGQLFFDRLDFVVSHPSDRSLVMSGEQVSHADNGDGTATAHWALTHRSEGYVGLALADFARVEGRCGDAVLEIYAMPGPTEDGIPVQPGTYVPLLETMCADYQQRFGPVAFETVRFVGVHEGFDNGYSTPGLVLVPNYIWDDDGTGSFIQRDFYLAHELSHQWWGNDVFIENARDWWLVEGMADYCACTCLGRTQGVEAERWIWLWEVQELLEYYDEGGVDHPLAPETPMAMEPRIVYIKGAWVLRMLEDVMGADGVEQLLGALRAEHAFAPLRTETFIAEAHGVAGEDLAWFFEQWLFGQGLLNLDESHEESGQQLSLTVAQQSVWSSNPVRYFRFPLQVLLKKGDQTRRHEIEVSRSEEEFLLSLP